MVSKKTRAQKILGPKKLFSKYLETKNLGPKTFHVLDYLDQFKATKENILKQVGHLDPLRAPTHLRLSQKPKFVVFFF